MSAGRLTQPRNDHVGAKSRGVRRSRTVSTTPKHYRAQNNSIFLLQIANSDPIQANASHHYRSVMQSGSNNSSITTIVNNRSSLGWDGPPAHFMLPTHAINCRHSRSIERCPRACKGNPRPATLIRLVFVQTSQNSHGKASERFLFFFHFSFALIVESTSIRSFWTNRLLSFHSYFLWF